MPDEPTTDRVRCGDIKLGLRLHSEILNAFETTLRENRLDLDAIHLRSRDDFGEVVPINWPPIITDKGCRIRIELPGLDDLTAGTAMRYMRAMLQLPWAILAALPDDHLFDLPAVIEPLGLAKPAAGEARG